MPKDLARALSSGGLSGDAVKFLTIMAFVDGTLDKAKIANVLWYAAELGVQEEYLDDIREAAQDRMQEALAHMTRSNMESITGKAWSGDANIRLLPYAGQNADPLLAQRFRNLEGRHPSSFGHAFWAHFKENEYASLENQRD